MILVSESETRRLAVTIKTIKMAKSIERSVESLLGLKSESTSKEYKVKQFFEDYMTTDESESYIETLKRAPNGIAYTEIFFKGIKAGLKIISPLLTKRDKAGNDYYWAVLSNNSGTKMILESGMSAFISDVQNGLIKPNFDFYDLIEEMQRKAIETPEA